MRLLRSKTSFGEMQRIDIVLQTNGQLPGCNPRRDVLKHLSAHARLRRNGVFAQRTNQRFASLGSDFLILILHELPEFIENGSQVGVNLAIGYGRNSVKWLCRLTTAITPHLAAIECTRSTPNCHHFVLLCRVL